MSCVDKPITQGLVSSPSRFKPSNSIIDFPSYFRFISELLSLSLSLSPPHPQLESMIRKQSGYSINLIVEKFYGEVVFDLCLITDSDYTMNSGLRNE